MRDYYDLLWYLNNDVDPNYAELEELGLPVKDRKDLVNLLQKKGKDINGKEVIAVIGKMLVHPEEKKVLRDYAKAFQQASKRFLKES